MRPVRLLLQGFTAFRSMDEAIDFSDADLFALTGPTGSGKSSVVDAICFALYGSVPRLDKGKVEPIISLGAHEARISFEFTVDGRPYVAARKVVRTKTGATTSEARLEGGTEVVSGADQVTEAVENLLGLPFEDFTKSVVLPQGEFAAFLHDKPAKRQDLLRRLLDLDVYERARRLAQQRKAATEAEAVLLEHQSAELGDVDENVEEEAKERSEALADVRRSAEEVRPRLAELDDAMAAATREIDELQSQLSAVKQIRPTEGLAMILAAGSAAAADLETRTAEARAALERLEAAEKASSELGDPVEIAEALRLHRARSDLETRRQKGIGLIAETEAELSRSAVLLSEATAARHAAVAADQRIRVEHAAHAIRADMHDGDRCPVCLQEVPVVPRTQAPAALAETEKRRADAEGAERRVAGEHERLTARLEGYKERLADIDRELGGLAAQLENRPQAEEAAALSERMADAKTEVEEARRAEQEARAGLDRASAAHAEARRREADAWRAIDLARDAVAGLSPPVPDREDLRADWDRLMEWSVSTAEEMEAKLSIVRRRVEEVGSARSAVLGDLVERSAGLGIEAAEDRLFDLLLEASMQAAAVLERIREQRRRAAELAEKARERRARADLAGGLARHLSANGFQAWILEEAFVGLVQTANQMLEQLSSGSYSLRVEKRDFAVIDHRNADETRSVKTLSGGETFLVSLALALALAEQLSTIAGASGARLESIFLDEGFGTLDAEALETVASVIQELGATGRTVGIITHVTELAEQIPVRFEVRKLPGGSTVERVPA